MAFTMRYWKNGKNWIHSLFIAFLLLGSVQAADLAQFQAERSDEGVLLSAQVRFDMSNVIEDTLSKGIPLFFVMDGQVVRERWYWIDKKVCGSERRVRLAFQPLMRRWRLSVATGSFDSTLGLTLSRNFESLGDRKSVM